eukprot:4119748-Alexandrium_andersonii.AAC.1
MDAGGRVQTGRARKTRAHATPEESRPSSRKLTESQQAVMHTRHGDLVLLVCEQEPAEHISKNASDDRAAPPAIHLTVPKTPREGDSHKRASDAIRYQKKQGPAPGVTPGEDRATTG